MKKNNIKKYVVTKRNRFIKHKDKKFQSKKDKKNAQQVKMIKKVKQFQIKDILNNIKKIEKIGCSCDLLCGYICDIHLLVKETENMINIITYNKHKKQLKFNKNSDIIVVSE